MHNPVIVGSAAAVYGTTLAFADPHSFKSPTFELQFDVLPRTWWAVLFIAAGLAVVALPKRVVPAVALLAVIGAWVTGLLRGVITGVAAGPGGWVWPTALMVSLVVSYVRLGIGDGR